MSSRSYSGRHRGSTNGPRVPRTLRSGFMLPTAAAAALVLTATGATVAESAPHLTAVSNGQAKTRAVNAAFEQAERIEQRQQLELRTAAVQARVQELQRVSRDQQRKALAAKQAEVAKAAALAKAEAERRAKEKEWVMPIDGATFTSGYGMRWGRMHEGNDFATPVGTPLHAMSKGEVTFAGQEGGYGTKVEIEYWDGTVTYYGHMSEISVNVGESVDPGDIVGYSGNTGHSTGPHLHLEIHPDGGGAVDPAPWLEDHGLQ